MIYIFGKLVSPFYINVSKDALKYFLVRSSVQNISNNVKHVLLSFLFDWYHKMVSPQNGDTRRGPPRPLSDATVENLNLDNSRQVDIHYELSYCARVIRQKTSVWFEAPEIFPGA